jgi:hypothetical protein
VNPVAIAGVGMVTPGAGDAGGSVGCIFVEARRFDALPSIGGISLAGAKSPIADEIVGVERLVQLGSRALWEAVDAETAKESLGLVVCAPAETEEPALAGQTRTLLARLAIEAELHLAPRASQVFASGRNAIFDALPFALAALAQNDVSAVCLLGVDSLVTRPRLRRFVEQGGAVGAGHPTPGEAAAAVVLTRGTGPSRFAMLVGLGVTNQGFLDQDGPSHPGKALVAAVDRAVAEAELERPKFSGLAYDMAGSAQDTEELAWTKTGSVLATSTDMETVFPHVATGDAGAAMGVLTLATTAFLVHKTRWSALGLCCLSGAGRRGAAILCRNAG